MREKKRRVGKVAAKPMIALDGPSALMLYRDRDEALQKSVDGGIRSDRASARASRFGGLFSSERDRRLDGEASTGIDDDSQEDWYYLSDEDVAAELLADANVFGSALQRDWADKPDEEASHQDQEPAYDNSSARFHVSDDDGSLKQLNRIARLERTRRCDLSRCASRSSELKQIPFDALGIEPPMPSSPLYLLVSHCERRRQVRNVHERVCSSVIEPDYFKLLGNQVLVPAPEFCFLLLAKDLSLPNLVQIGMELCGHYRMVGALSNSLVRSRRTIYNCDVLTTPERIRDFLANVRGFPGISRARRAARYLVSGSASPMETILYLLLCLPRTLGGYGMPAPSLNVKRGVNKSASKFTFARTLVPDLYWSEARLDVEYDSEEFHAEEAALKRGARRTMALRAMHVDVFSMTGDMVRDSVAFDGFAHLLARRLHKRIRRPGQATLRRHQELRASLLS